MIRVKMIQPSTADASLAIFPYHWTSLKHSREPQYVEIPTQAMIGNVYWARVEDSVRKPRDLNNSQPSGTIEKVTVASINKIDEIKSYRWNEYTEDIDEQYYEY